MARLEDLNLRDESLPTAGVSDYSQLPEASYLWDAIHEWLGAPTSNWVPDGVVDNLISVPNVFACH